MVHSATTQEERHVLVEVVAIGSIFLKTHSPESFSFERSSWGEMMNSQNNNINRQMVSFGWSCHYVISNPWLSEGPILCPHIHKDLATKGKHSYSATLSTRCQILGQSCWSPKCWLRVLLLRDMHDTTWWVCVFFCQDCLSCGLWFQGWGHWARLSESLELWPCFPIFLLIGSHLHSHSRVRYYILHQSSKFAKLLPLVRLTCPFPSALNFPTSLAVKMGSEINVCLPCGRTADFRGW